MSANSSTPDNRVQIRERIPETLPAELMERSDTKGLARLAAHTGLLGCTGTLVFASTSTWWSVPAMLVHGVVLAFLFSPLHECIHRTAFRSRWLNDAVAFLCGLALLLPRKYFRAFHLQHHRSTQDPVRDPELSVRKPETIGEYLLHISGLPYWCERMPSLVRHARGKVAESYIAEPQRVSIAIEARLHLVLYALAIATSLLAQSGALMVYWVVPLLLGQPFLRAFLLAEHTGCPMIPDMLMNSRTTRTNHAVTLLTWNMPYHAEHHAWAAVPFHNLPRVHELCRERIGNTAAGYIAVHRGLWRNLGRA